MPESAHMVVAEDFATSHKDLVHHVAYDFYGRRMATCSSDHSVKVWDLQDGQWVLSAELKVLLMDLTASAVCIYSWAGI